MKTFLKYGFGAIALYLAVDHVAGTKALFGGAGQAGVGLVKAFQGTGSN